MMMMMMIYLTYTSFFCVCIFLIMGKSTISPLWILFFWKQVFLDVSQCLFSGVIKGSPDCLGLRGCRRRGYNNNDVLPSSIGIISKLLNCTLGFQRLLIQHRYQKWLYLIPKHHFGYPAVTFRGCTSFESFPINQAKISMPRSCRIDFRCSKMLITQLTDFFRRPRGCKKRKHVGLVGKGSFFTSWKIHMPGDSIR